MANDNENYNLYTEKIKIKPSVKYKKLISLVKLAALAAFAGAIAGMVFLVVIGLGGEVETETDSGRQEITIPMDDPTASTDETAAVTEPTKSEGDIKYAGDSAYQQVSEVVKNVSPMLVQITAIDRNEDPIFSVIENERTYPGIIVGDNDIEYLILTNSDIANVDVIEVTFADGNKINGALVLVDDTVGIAIVAVGHEDLPVDTVNMLKIAELGNSYMLKQGELVIASGNLRGIGAAVDFGAVVSTREMSYDADSRHGLIYTNMGSGNDNAGFLFNEEGQLIGCISRGHSRYNVVAYGISDIKIRIQNLINHKQIGYLGVVGREVDEKTSLSYNMPVGVYVTAIENNSPAYFSGIMIGDIIVDINGRTISNVFGIERAMCEFEPGTEVKVNVQRKGREGYVPIEFTITLSEK